MKNRFLLTYFNSLYLQEFLLNNNNAFHAVHANIKN